MLGVNKLEVFRDRRDDLKADDRPSVVIPQAKEATYVKIEKWTVFGA